MLIKTTAKHAMLLQTPPIGRYHVKLVKVEEKTNKKGDGTNAILSFEIADGDFEGKPFDVYCSIGNKFGIANLLMIHQALTGTTESDIQFDPADDIGCVCVGEVGHELYNGSKIGKLQGFLPLKNPVTGAETPLTTPF